MSTTHINSDPQVSLEIHRSQVPGFQGDAYVFEMAVRFLENCCTRSIVCTYNTSISNSLKKYIYFFCGMCQCVTTYVTVSVVCASVLQLNITVSKRNSRILSCASLK